MNEPDSSQTVFWTKRWEAGKTPWDFGPVLRYDLSGPADDRTYHRWTGGVFYGLPGEFLRFILSYELPYDDGPHDDRLTVWGQVEF